MRRFLRNYLLKKKTNNEKYFVCTHSRTAEGKYTVRLPFKTGSPIDIGNSLPIATARTSRLQSSLEISKQYYNLLHEYLKLGHMELVTDAAMSFKSVYMLPHHAVVRDSSSTTKLRVILTLRVKLVTVLRLTTIYWSDQSCNKICRPQ